MTFQSEPSNKKEKVSIVRCHSYNPSEVYEAVRRSLELLGGVKKFIPPGKKMLIKPNLLANKPIKKAVNTHPSVISAVARLIRENNSLPLIGDNPGIVNIKTVLEMEEYKHPCSQYNIDLVEFKNFQMVESDDSYFKRHQVSKEVLDTDWIINLPKLKTHTHMLLTAAVKNLFGCVNKKSRIQWHLKTGISKIHFAHMLIELYRIIRPQITIVDAIIGMEGDGPSSGTPREIGLIIAGENCVAVDVVICKILDIDPQEVFTNVAAYQKEVFGSSLEQIQIMGENLQDVKIKNFRFPKTAKRRSLLLDVEWGIPLPKPLRSFLKKQLTPRPKVIERLCQNCRACVEVCPAKAIYEEKYLPKINQNLCIRCFCCQELCPHHAIEVKDGFLAKFLK